MYVIKLDTENAPRFYGGYYGERGFNIIDQSFVFETHEEAINFIEKEIQEIESFAFNCCECEDEWARLKILANCLKEFSLIEKNDGFVYPKNHKPKFFGQN